MECSQFFQRLWEQYTAVTPQAQRIFEAVQTRADLAGRPRCSGGCRPATR